MQYLFLDIFSGWLLEWDRLLFYKINNEWSNSFFDIILPIWREKKTWIVLYLLIVIISIIKFKKKAIPFLAFIVIAAILSDVISSHFFKPFIGRIRPCGQPELMDIVILRHSYCPGNGSFTSSHATIHFALAVYLFVTLKRWLGAWVWLYVVWALVICYAQIYMGIHFPTDIIGGTILGSIIGLGFGYLNLKVWKVTNKKT